MAKNHKIKDMASIRWPEQFFRNDADNSTNIHKGIYNNNTEDISRVMRISA